MHYISFKCCFLFCFFFSLSSDSAFYGLSMVLDDINMLVTSHHLQLSYGVMAF